MKFHLENDFTRRSQALWLQSQRVSVVSVPGCGDRGHQPHYHLGPEEPRGVQDLCLPGRVQVKQGESVDGGRVSGCDLVLVFCLVNTLAYCLGYKIFGSVCKFRTENSSWLGILWVFFQPFCQLGTVLSVQEGAQSKAARLTLVQPKHHSATVQGGGGGAGWGPPPRVSLTPPPSSDCALNLHPNGSRVWGAAFCVCPVTLRSVERPCLSSCRSFSSVAAGFV